MVRVSSHAVSRFRERVAPLPEAEVRAILSSTIIERAAAFGACFVRLGTGHRIVIQGDAVVTVLPADHYRRQIRRYGMPRYRG